jgi:hypothetical protein
MKVQVDAVFHCKPETYFEQLFDPSTREKRELVGRGALRYQIIESDTQGETWHQIAESTEKLEAPAPVRKVMGETTRIREEVTWKKGASTGQVSYTPDKLSNRTTVSGVLEARPEGEDHCRVTLSVEVRIKVFGVGKMIEKLSADKLQADFRKDADFFNREIAPGL